MNEFNVRIFKTTAELLSLEPRWNELLKLSSSRNIFLTFEWLATWWRIFGAGKMELQVITVSKNEELIAIAPLYKEKKLAAVLKFMSAGAPLYPDYLNCIVKEGYEEVAVDTIMRIVAALSWDYLDFSDLEEKNILSPLLKKYSQYHCRGKVYEKKAAQCAYVKLPGTYEEYIAGLSKQHRKKIVSSQRKAAAAFSVEYGTWPHEKIAAGLEEMGKLHRRRWSGRKATSTFVDKKYIDFHQTFGVLAARQKFVNVRYVKFNGAVVALIYLFHYQQKDYYYQSGFDPAYYSFRPGTLLLDYVIRCAIGHGLAEFDFLKGDHSYKKEWTNEVRNTISLLFFRKSIYGFLAFLQKYAAGRIKKFLTRESGQRV